MPQLEWNEADVVGFLEVLPEVEEYEVSHTFLFNSDAVILKLQFWQLESVIQISLLNPDNSVLTEYALFIHGGVKWIKGAEEYLLIKHCYLAPRRFSYMLDKALIKNNDQGRVLNVKINIKPSINITLTEIGSD